MTLLEHPTTTTRDHVDGAVRAVVDRLADRFGRFHEGRLRAAATTLDARIRRSTARLDTARVLHDLLDGLADDLDAIAIRALITAFRESGQAHAEFADRIGSDDVADAIQDSAPELRRLLDLRTDRGVRHAIEVLDHLDADRALLEDRLGLRGTIVSVATGRGDKHDGGRSVTIVRAEDGTGVVHKPAPVEQGLLLGEIARAADPDGSVFGPVIADAIAGRAEDGTVRPHSWQPFVDHDDLPDAASVERWFERYGAVVALAAATGATDLHFENVVATAEGPVLVDVETVTSAWTPPRPDTSAHAALSERIDHSVLHSMLLPTRFLGSAVGADISGLRSAATASTAMPGFAVVDAGLDTMRFDDTDVVVPVAANAVTLGGHPVDARDHLPALVAGYRRGRSALLDAADRIDAVLEDAVPEEVRQVVRPTYVYARFVDASTHPAYLGSVDDRRALFERLPARFRTVRDDAAERLHALEVAALVELDVPSLHLGRDSTTLHARMDGTDVAVPDAVHLDLAATLRAWMADFRARDARREESDIVLALAAAADDAWESHDRPPLALGPDGEHVALTRSADGTSATWLSTVMLGTGLRLAPVNLTLFEGGGQLVALAEAAAHDRGPLTTDDVTRVLRGAVVHGVPAEPEVWHLSPYTGALADSVTLVELAARGHDDPRRTALPGAFAAPFLAAAEVTDLDHLNGLGGYLRALRVHAASTVGVDGPAVGRALDDLFARRGSALAEPDPDGGLAHGTAGRVLAIADAAAIAGRHRRAEQFVLDALHRWDELVVRSAGLRDGRARSSWCKGAAGTVFAHEQAMRAVGSSTQEVLAAIRPELDLLLATPLPAVGEDVDASFCHGVAGTVAVLRDLGTRLGLPELTRAAGRLVDRTSSARPRGGLRRAPEVDTFFLGSSSWTAVRDDVTLPLLLGGIA